MPRDRVQRAREPCECGAELLVRQLSAYTFAASYSRCGFIVGWAWATAEAPPRWEGAAPASGEEELRLPFEEAR